MSSPTVSEIFGEFRSALSGPDTYLPTKLWDLLGQVPHDVLLERFVPYIKSVKRGEKQPGFSRNLAIGEYLADPRFQMVTSLLYSETDKGLSYLIQHPLGSLRALSFERYQYLSPRSKPIPHEQLKQVMQAHPQVTHLCLKGTGITGKWFAGNRPLLGTLEILEVDGNDWDYNDITHFLNALTAFTSLKTLVVSPTCASYFGWWADQSGVELVG